MRYGIRDIPRLLETPVGRRHLRAALVLNLRPALVPIAGMYRRIFQKKVRIVAVVGSFGKTTAMRALKLALFDRSKPVTNSESFVALGMLLLRSGMSRAVFEVGIDRPGRMARFAWMVKPDIVVVTSIGSEHNTSFGTMLTTREEKVKMVRALPPHGIAVLNGDDTNVLWMKKQTSVRTVTYGFGHGNDVRITKMELLGPKGTRLYIEGLKQKGVLETRLIGRPMAYAVLGAVATALAEGFSFDQAKYQLRKLFPIPERLEPIELDNGAWLICDTFKGAIETVGAALELMAIIPNSRRIVILGMVEEPMERSGELYRNLGRRVAKVADHVIFVGKNRLVRPFRSQAIQSGLSRQSITWCRKPIPDALEALPYPLKPGDIVLIKGRGSQRLERIVLALTGHTVKCTIRECKAGAGQRCNQCKMLSVGWGQKRVM